MVDYLGAAFGLVLISPFLLVIAVLIKFDSTGPVLFRQTRIGKDGRPFVFYKFRSMRDGCDSAVHREHVTKLIHGELGEGDRGPDGSFKLEDDARITNIGRVVRRTSVDELPQLLNVVRGDMSLIGPPYEVPAVTLNRMCGSSQQAIHFAAEQVAAGDAFYSIGAGVESMTRVPMFCDVGSLDKLNPELARFNLMHQGESAERLAEKYKITRRDVDEFSMESHRRASAAARDKRNARSCRPPEWTRPASP